MIVNHLSGFEPSRFEQRQVIFYNSYSNTVLMLINLNFKSNTKIKLLVSNLLNKNLHNL